MSLFVINPNNVLHFKQLDGPLKDLVESANGMHMITLWVPGSITKSISLNLNENNVSMDYTSGPVRGIINRLRYRAYCKKNGLAFSQETVGELVWVRASVGLDIQNVIRIVQDYFKKMHRHESGRVVQYSFMQWNTDT